MSKPRYDWWSYVKGMIYRYPALTEQHNLALAQKVTPAYTGMPGGGETSRTTETVAVKAMTKTATREYEAVHLAEQKTASEPGGDDRMKLVEMIYWRRTHTLSGAAQSVHVSYITAKRWNAHFIKQVAKNYGFFD